VATTSGASARNSSLLLAICSGTPAAPGTGNEGAALATASSAFCTVHTFRQLVGTDPAAVGRMHTVGVCEGWGWLRPVVGLDVLEPRQVGGAQPHQPRRRIHRLHSPRRQFDRCVTDWCHSSNTLILCDVSL
jgi:hypothetical protein